MKKRPRKPKRSDGWKPLVPVQIDSESTQRGHRRGYDPAEVESKRHETVPDPDDWRLPE